MFIEKVIGFDAREMYLDPLVDWTAERRQKFLLKDVERPLSVDHRVWQSLFDLLPPPHESTRKNWWLELSDLVDNAALWGEAIKPCWIIAMTQFVESQDDQGTTPSEVSRDWRFLGYDVADGTRISFLSNAGRGEEMPQNRITWGGYLNDDHLFSEASQAQEFADYCEARETMHGPYAIFGLYVIQSLGL